MAGKHIVIVEDTDFLAQMYGYHLKNEDYNVTTFDNGKSALSYLKDNKHVDLFLVDLKLPDIDGLDLIKEIQSLKITAPTIVMTGYGGVDTALQAIRIGAKDFLVKPFDLNDLTTCIQNAVNENPQNLPAQKHEESKSTEEFLQPLAGRSGDPDFCEFLGLSLPMQRIYKTIELSGQSMANVFISGESGTGKRTCAEAIHKNSTHKDGEFKTLNCLDFLVNYKSLEEHTTVFIPEILQISEEAQFALLDILESEDFQSRNIRFMCSCSKDPYTHIQKQTFLEDLLYHLQVITIHMPPLREREQDIVDLAKMFLKKYDDIENKNFQSFSFDAEDTLKNYSWPGNIRELQSTIHCAVIMNQGRIITKDMLPEKIRQEKPASENKSDPEKDDLRPLWEIERDAIEKTIEACNGNIPKAASILEISPSTIYRKKSDWEVSQELSETL